MDLNLSQQFFIEKIKVEMDTMTKEQLKDHIVDLIRLQYQKDQMWLRLLNDRI